MFKLFRAGPGQGDGLASAERLQLPGLRVGRALRFGGGLPARQYKGRSVSRHSAQSADQRQHFPLSGTVCHLG